MDDGLVYYVNQVRAAIRKVDPTALVDASFFVPEAPNPTRIGDTRILRMQGVVERSQADLVDIHIYPGFDLTLAQFMQNFGLSGPTKKVVFIGEYGAFRDAYPSAADGLGAMRALQAGSCSYGIDGWLLWTWDTDRIRRVALERDGRGRPARKRPRAEEQARSLRPVEPLDEAGFGS